MASIQYTYCQQRGYPSEVLLRQRVHINGTVHGKIRRKIVYDLGTLCKYLGRQRTDRDEENEQDSKQEQPGQEESQLRRGV